MLEIMDTAGTEQFSKSPPTPLGEEEREEVVGQETKKNQCALPPTQPNTPRKSPTNLPSKTASIREMYMRYAQGFLLVFSITSTTSLSELGELREQIAHMKNHDPAIPIVLVGNKADLEDDRRVSRAKAFQVSQMWGNIPYYETSARRRLNVNEVFVDVCRQIIRRDLSGGKGRGGGGGSGGGGSGGGDGGGRDGRRRRKKRDGEGGGGSRCVIL